MFEMSKTKLGIIFILLLVMFNPTGYSYFDYVMIHSWGMNISTAIVAMFGGLMLGFLLFLFSFSWKSTQVFGKILYLVPFAGLSFIMFILDAFSNTYYLYSFIIMSVYTFILWGMTYPRIKLGWYKEHNIDDVESE